MQYENLSAAIQDCWLYELHDEIVRFDSIIDSFMTTDVPKEKLRKELSDWQFEIENIVVDILFDEELEREKQIEVSAIAEELFGTEV